ncbi:hypothetical protein VA7868_00882 [Vibrio aerogenes CECT 7868]|uniref:Uncharacterized protein n=1 Tax=Vibrio aerogenes CECT 7868 TaxID=1216006 RepID=A0A1M5WV34_9VIBR|nr:hypothetical protein [Vibrio aerogenes]SHH91361.1 hypothetical protein VA7868_00882 [Vibrio aerogenes CECT 7868]
MNQNQLTTNLAEADQSVKNFIADLLVELNNQLKQQSEPCIHVEYFGVLMEIKLLAFGEQQITPCQKAL